MMVTRQTQRKRKNAPTRPETETQKPRGKRSKDFRESVFIPFLFRSDSRASSLVAEVTKDEAKLFLPTVLPNFIKAIQLADEDAIAAENYRWAFYAVSQPSIS